MNQLSRRRFLQLAALGGAAFVGACAPPTANQPPTSMGSETASRSTFTPDLEINLAAQPASVQILPGAPTTVWTYQPTVVRGEASAVQAVPGSYLGPVLRVRKGQRLRVNFVNNLPDDDQASIIHWHGMLVPAAMDGHPRDAVAPGQTYTYEFEIANRAGSYWFHPHPHGRTGEQVYRGLAGLLLVSDDEEAALSLPRDVYDIPLVIQDRTFDTNNQLQYMAGGMGGHGMGGMGGMNMAAMMGFLGERVLVNGQPDFALPVATRAYRLRLLNGSNARIYKLGWSDSTPLTVIGSDGGLLAAPVQRPYVMLAPGERVELWADFRDVPLGTTLTMDSLAFSGAEGDHGMMGGMMNIGNPPELGAPLTLFTVRVERNEPETLALPQRLTTIERLPAVQAVNAAAPRSIALTLNGMQWQLNGRQFEIDSVAPDEVVKLQALERWEFVNKPNPGAMIDAMGMAHPMHIHSVQFQVVERVVDAALRAGYDTVREGHVDDGWKDTVLVMPGERVAVVMRFGHAGTFVYHCHNLEHEDGGMMRNYRVEA